MKLRSIILSAATILGLAACQKPEDLGTPNVISSDNKLEFTQDGGTKTIQVNATVDWQLKDYTDEVKEWVVIDPSSGKASASDQTITIKVLPNEGKSRSAVITFYGNVLAKAAVTINQDGPLGTGVVPQGDGTLESPYSASQAHAEALKLASGASGSSYVYVKGFVKKVASVDTGSYGNANFYITDAADGAGDDFYCFQVMYLAGAKFTAADQIKVGDEVVVRGKLTNFNGTPETVGKGDGRIVSLNGEAEGTVTEPDPGTDPVDGTAEGDGSLEHPYNATAANAAASALASGAESSQFFYIKGFVKKIKEIDTGTYGNATFWITDDKEHTTKDFYCFQVMYLDGAKFTSADQLKVDDEVVVYAKLTNYNGTLETVGKGSGKLYSVNGTVGQGEPEKEKVEAEGTVVALNKLAFLVKTSDGYAYAFDKDNAPTVKVGDNVKVSGEKDTYGDLPEIVNYTVTVVSSGNAVTHPTATAITSENVAGFKTMFGYVSTTGKLTISGDYYNVNIGSSAITVSIPSPVSLPADYNGKNIDIKGYYTGLTGSGKYFNILATDVTLSAEQTPVDPGTPENPGDGGGSSDDASLTPGENEVLYALTHQEILDCVAANTSSSYQTLTFTSAGGNWVGNVMTSSSKTALTYLQFRNNNASYLTSPKYASKVKRIVVVTSSDKFPQTQDKNLRVAAVPVVDPATLPTGKDANKNNINYTDAQMAGAYGYFTLNTTKPAQAYPISFSGDATQFSLLTIDGAMYLDSIYVFCEK